MAKPVSLGINVTRLEQQILDLGVRIRLWKSSICPNMTSLESIDHDPNCSICTNNMIDFDSMETIALFQQQTLTEQFKVLGTFNLDEVLVTFPIGVHITQMAKVEVLDFVDDFSELIQRQEGTNIDVLKYQACTIEAIFVIRSNVQIRYYQGTDFELDINGSVKWTSSRKPNDREIYTIYYKYHPVYRAIKAVHRDRFTQFNSLKDLQGSSIDPQHYKKIGDRVFVKCPDAWVLKRDFLIDRKDKSQATPTKIAQNTYYDPNEDV